MNLTQLTFPPSISNLKIRYWRTADFECVVGGAKDPYIPMTTSIPSQCDEAGALDWIKRQNMKVEFGSNLPLCIASESTDEALGMIGLFGLSEKDENPSGGYWLSPQNRGQGIAGIILNMITPWAFQELHLGAIELLIEPNNIGSNKTALQAGYLQMKLLKSHTQIDGLFRDMYLYRAQPIIDPKT